MRYLLLIFLCFSSLFANEGLSEKNTRVNLDKVKSYESKESMEHWLHDNYGLKPYKANYILPFGYSNRQYTDHHIDGVKYIKTEAEIQLSTKLEFFHNIFGLGERYSLAYTQQVFWQLYVKSSPMRETLYNPEAYVIFPISDKESFFNIRSFKFAIAHKSNGQPNTIKIPGYHGFNLSKSINYVYATLRLQHSTLITDLTLQAPYLTGSNLSDNPDIMNYMGYTKIKFIYFKNKNMFTLMMRGNIGTAKGAAEATYSYPLKSETTYLYMKFFSGFMESLIDYNRYVTKFSIGFSFSR